MAETAIVIVGGVRYRREDAARLGISVKTPDAPATLAAAEAAKAAEAEAKVAANAKTAAAAKPAAAPKNK